MEKMQASFAVARRWRSSAGVWFDRDAGCRRCWIAQVELNEDGLCEYCARFVQIREKIGDMPQEIFERLLENYGVSSG